MDVSRLGNEISLHANLTQQRLKSETERLSSGLRVNNAQDDPSGLAISESLRTLASGVDTGAQNLRTANNLLTVGEGALSTTTDILQRVRTLLVQSNSDITSSGDRSNIQTEINQLLQEVNRISSNAQFNGINLLDGSLSNKGTQNAQAIERPAKLDENTGLLPPTQVASGSSLIANPTVGNGVSASFVQFKITDYQNPAFDPVSGLPVTPPGPGIFLSVIAYGGDPAFGPQIVATTAFATGQPPLLNASITTISTPVQSILQFDLPTFSQADVGVAQSFQTIRDTPADGGQPLQISSGHVEGDVLPVGMPNTSTSSLGIGYISVYPLPDVTDTGTNPPVPGSSSDAAATDALYRIDLALDSVSNARAQIGSQTVAVENAISNNELQGVNITASESNIRDANMGAEETAHTKDQILVSVQSQLLKTVNLNAQDVLKLFGGGR